MAAAAPRFFAGFSLQLFLLRTTVGYIGLLATGNEIADYNATIAAWRDVIKAGNGVVFQLYAAWLAVAFVTKLARLKVAYDLNVLRAERARGGRRR